MLMALLSHGSRASRGIRSAICRYLWAIVESFVGNVCTACAPDVSRRDRTAGRRIERSEIDGRKKVGRRIERSEIDGRKNGKNGVIANVLRMAMGACLRALCRIKFHKARRWGKKVDLAGKSQGD